MTDKSHERHSDFLTRRRHGRRRLAICVAITVVTMVIEFVDKIYMVEIGDHLKADRLPQEALIATGKVEVLLQHEVKAIHGKTAVEGIELTNRRSNSTKELKVQGVFVFIGRIPSTEFLKGYVELDKHGFIKTPCDPLETNHRNVFAVGDVRSGNRAQVTTAVGDGTIAAFFIRETLHEAAKG